MRRRLEGKVVIVTGGATGIGEAVCHRMAKDGAAVVVNGLEGDPVEEVAASIHRHGGVAFPCFGDVSDPSQARGCVQKAIEHCGRLDVLVANAGTFQTVADVDRFPLEDFDYMMRMNVRSAFLMTKYALPHLRASRGVVLFTGSEAGLLGQPKCAAYGGSKGWIHGFMRSVALEQAPHGVRANCVSPGPIATSWHDTDISPMTKEMEQDILDATPLGRHGTPEEAANVFAFLASDEASFITGAIYFVDGGISIGRGPSGRKVPRELRDPPAGRLELEHSQDGLKNKWVHFIE